MTRSPAAALAALVVLTALAAGCSDPKKRCAAPATECAGACVDLALDPGHCGACGNACPAGKVCSAGACADACAAPLATCVDAGTAYCATTSSDPRNCGACGNVCADGLLCSAGTCAPSCAAPLARCAVGDGSACVDLSTDALHCGACATRCAADQVCSGGSCAAACGGATPDLCGGSCTALASDTANCGACGHACGAGDVCDRGACADPCALAGGVRCDGACVFVATDPANCGACGTPCAAPGVCVAGTCAPPLCAAPALRAPSLVTTVRAKSIVVRDLDLDGHADVVVPQYDGPAVQILRGLGDGRFSAPEVLSFGAGFKNMAAGDVDGDGLPDLVFLDHDAGLLSTFRNAGPGGFVPLSSEPTSVNALALGDVDRDGRADLVLADWALEVRASTAGTWTTGFGDWSSPWTSIAVADLNGDGLLDLVAGRNSGEGYVGVFVNQGDGTFATPLAYRDELPAIALAAGDLDGDGATDVVVWGERWTPSYAEVIALYRGDGAGGLAAPEIVAELPTDVAYYDYRYDLVVADLDGDGDVDLAIGEANVLRVYLNRGDGTFEPVTYPAAYPQALGVADVDGDAVPDLLVASAPSTGVEIRRGIGGGAFATMETIDRPASAVAIADLDGDGRGDVVAVDWWLGTVTVLRSLGAAFGEPVTYAWPGVAGVVAGDLDGDGIVDLVLTAGWFYSASEVTILRGRGDGTFDPPVSLAGSGGGPALADVNGDGALDLVLVAQDELYTMLGRGDGSFTVASASVPLGAYVEGFAGVGDLDGDGLADAAILWDDWGDVRVRVYRSRGDGTFDPAPIDAALPPLIDPYLGAALFTDLDGDGLADAAVLLEEWVEWGLLGSIVRAGSVHVFRNVGGGFAAPVRNVTAGSSHDLTVARVSGAGRRDLAIVDANSGIALLPANGDTRFGPPVRWAVPHAAYGVAAGDLDGDGRDDVVVGGYGRMAVLRTSCP